MKLWLHATTMILCFEYNVTVIVIVIVTVINCLVLGSPHPQNPQDFHFDFGALLLLYEILERLTMSNISTFLVPPKHRAHPATGRPSHLELIENAY